MRQDRKFVTRLYGILLHLYPSDFRHAYGDAMTCVFEESLCDAYARSGNSGVLTLWLHTLTDLAVAAPAEWTSRLVFSVSIELRTSLAATIAIHAIVLFSLILMGVNAGALHPRSSSTPGCGKVKLSRSSSSAPRATATLAAPQRVAR